MRKKLTLNHSNGEIKLSEAFENFIKKKQVSNLSPDTIQFYKRCYNPFKEFFGIDFPCCDFNEDNFFDYLGILKNSKNLSPITVNTHIRGLRAILYYFMEKEYTPYFKIKLIRCEKPIKETYTNSEIQKLIKKPDIKTDSFAQFRNWAMVCYLLATGNRLRTVRNLKIEDLDFEDMEIKLHHVKNKKAYIIPMSKSLKEVLVEYLYHRQGEPHNYVFCNSYGKQMTKDTFVTAISQYNKSRGVEKTSTHLFRHTFAKNWVMNGGDIFRLQRMLGHSSLEMVKEYVSIYGNDLKNEFDRFNALDNHSQYFESKKTIKMK